MVLKTFFKLSADKVVLTALLAVAAGVALITRFTTSADTEVFTNTLAFLPLYVFGRLWVDPCSSENFACFSSDPVPTIDPNFGIILIVAAGLLYWYLLSCLLIALYAHNKKLARKKPAATQR